MPPMKYRYSAVAIALHWIIAFGILGMIALGWYMGDLPNDASSKGSLFQLHKSLGILILLLTIVRIVWRVLNPAPPELPASPMQLFAAKAVHIGFYALMILMPLTGWILVSASARGLPTILFNIVEWPHLPFLPDLAHETKLAIFPILENAHGKLAWVAIALLGLHVAGALKHQFMDADGTMARMLPGLFGKTDGPQYRTRGAPLALGVAAVFFTVVVFIGAVSKATSVHEAKQQAAEQAKRETIIPNWQIDTNESEIAFTGIYNKKPFRGVFENWTARIQYDPEAIAKAAIIVEVEVASATTGDTYSDKSLQGPDFFDANAHPIATFKAFGAFAVEDGYELTGVLNMKGKDHPIRMPYQLDIDGNSASMTSEFLMNRAALELGLESDPDSEWISNDIQMQIKVSAVRTGH